MTLGEMKTKVLTLIEEAEENDTTTTLDPDIELKMISVINQIQYELARIKKIPDYVEIEVEENQLLTFEDITDESGYNVYQIDLIKGADHEYKAQGTIVKALEDGILEIEYFRYPTRIEENDNDFEFDLSDDVLEIMPYGVAGDILKADVSNAYGNVYSQRYELMKQQLSSKYHTGSIEFIDLGGEF